MNLFPLAFAYLRERPLNTFLNLFLLALGVAMIVVLLLFSGQVQQRLTRDARDIDLVVGAKGSPLQLILSSIYQIDIPTGNIALGEAKKIQAYPMVKRVIPMALGDAVAGFRIVGTDHSYPALYDAKAVQGALWEKPLEASLGAEVAKVTGLKVGETFVGSHGIGAGGAEHASNPYKVVGILAATGSVIDRLVLTSVASVWQVHDHHAERGQAAAQTGGGGHDPDHVDAAQPESDREITALLVQYKTPMAAALMPRLINSQSALQAAAPAFETARLLNLIGFGVDTLRAFAIVLIASAVLSMFIALTNALDERRYDLAIMRTLGGGKSWLLALVLSQGVIMALAGTAFGLLLGHLAAQGLGLWFNITKQMSFSGWNWAQEEWWLVLLALAVGTLAAVLPAVSAYRTDIAKTLAKEV
jgi:putative ABC transport system permease protein